MEPSPHRRSCGIPPGRWWRWLAPGLAVALSLLAGPARTGERDLDFLAVSGHFTAARACVDDDVPPALCTTIAPNANSIALGDLDSDGDQDMVLTRVSLPADACLDDGQGIFTCSSIIASRPDLTEAVLGDFNVDGRMDAVLGVSAFVEPTVPAQICFNAGGAVLICATLDAIDYDHSDLAVGDVNGDGAADIVTAGFDLFGIPSRVCLNDGMGVFAACADLAAPHPEDQAVTLADLDADGHLDAVFATLGGFADRVCLGNGAGLFACNGLSEVTSHQRALDVGDVDGDGILDLVFAGEDGSRLCPGAGDGAFPACLPLAPETSISTAVSLADLDGDGRAEMAFATLDEDTPNRLCRFLGYGPPPGSEPQLDCHDLDPAIVGPGGDVALWTRWIFQDGFESGDTSRWSSAVQ